MDSGIRVGLSSDEVDRIGDEQSTQSEKAGDKRKRKETSKYWRFFDKTVENGVRKAKCKACGHCQNCPIKDGTSNLKKHVTRCRKISQRDIRQMVLFDGGDTSPRFGVIDVPFEASKFRDLVSVAIIMHDLPFQFVEYSGVRSIFRYLNDEVPTISRNTARADVMKLYAKEKYRIQDMLHEACGRISLTSDLWTSITTDGYICLTAHWIDKNWVLQKRILNFCFMPPPHSGHFVADKLYSLLLEWGIDHKLFSMTLDNASSNDVAVELLKNKLKLKNALMSNGDFFHVRCCAHILNLIVQEGLKKIDSAIYKIRETVKYVKGSQARKQKFLESVMEMNLDKSRGLRQDVPTRWNSTFLMIDSALYYRLAFCNLKLNDSNYYHCLTDDEWDKVEKISKFLSVFYDITCLFSGTKYPTANLYFQKVFFANLKLRQNMESGDEYLKVMSTLMWTKFSKYWSEFSTILAIAAILDPRYKLEFVEFAYQKVYGSDPVPFNGVVEKLNSLFSEYKARFTSSSSTPTNAQVHESLNANVNMASEDRVVMEEFFTSRSSSVAVTGRKTQLELYLEEPRLQWMEKFDILEFWKGYQFRYPEVAAMARDILSIPISTVASESAFSVGGRVIDQFRSTLKPDSVEALICTRDWLFGDTVVNRSFELDDLTEDLTNLSITEIVDSTETFSSQKP